MVTNNSPLPPEYERIGSFKTLHWINNINGSERVNFPVSLHASFKLNCSLVKDTSHSLTLFLMFLLMRRCEKTASETMFVKGEVMCNVMLCSSHKQQSEELLLFLDLKTAALQKMAHVTCSTACGQRLCCSENFAATSCGHAPLAAFHPLAHNIPEGPHTATGVLEPHPSTSPRSAPSVVHRSKTLSAG